jgi:putative transposase
VVGERLAGDTTIGLVHSVARKLRIQYPGALYHVINRGNYRRDVFEAPQTALAFERALGEACEQHRWRIHAYAIMRNHFHLALETPEPTLVDGMHWLQSTFATRFNRLRRSRGHLFQGRYQAPLVEDASALLGVVNYIHLNPVRAHLVAPSEVSAFCFGSLNRFMGDARPSWLVADTFLQELKLPDNRIGWKAYAAYLEALATDPAEQERQRFSTLCRGWAIGTLGWRRALARQFSHLALAVGFEKTELCDIREQRWRDELELGLRAAGKTVADIAQAGPAERWKIEIAALLRRRVGAPYRWISMSLKMGTPVAVRMNVFRFLKPVTT